jgi:hypothetical protein
MAEGFFCVGECPCCETGPLGVRRCSACGRPHVLCRACRATWSSRDTAQPAVSAARSDSPCVQCGQSLWDTATSWATWQELIELDWPAPTTEVGGGVNGGKYGSSSAADKTPTGQRADSQAEG